MKHLIYGPFGLLACVLAFFDSPRAAAAEVSVGSLDLSAVAQGWGEARADLSVNGRPLSIGGRKFATGIGTHAASRFAVRLNGKAERFTAWVGVDDEVPAKGGSVVFRVLADGSEVWNSGVMRAGDAAKQADVPLAGVRQLGLLADDAGDGIGNDHADWADARITGKETTYQTSAFTLPKRFPHPDRIRYDGHCMTIEGRDTFIYSAAFHYFRCPRELWRDRFRAIKEAGFNTVETYVPWNWHERNMPSGLEDFSQVDLTEVGEWLRIAQDEFGFYTIVRPGPFICAEWAGGGYPRWLAKFGPGAGDLWLRGADPAHIAWSAHWYRAACGLFAREQLTRKEPGRKGIIMVQIENEYNHHSCPGKPELLRALYQAVAAAGVEVPVFTCATEECRGSMDPVLSQVFDCDNYYIGLTDAAGCATRMAGLRRRQPDSPGFVTELQGGWFSTVGGGLSEENHSDARHSNAIHMMSLLGGATGLNPYMFFGGTHFGGWGARGMTTTYDYNAAIRESGARGAKYDVARGISEFIRENESRLLRSEGGPCELRGAPKPVQGGVRVAADGTRFVFLHNADAKAPASGMLTVVPGKEAAAGEPLFNINQYGEKVAVRGGPGAAGDIRVAPFAVSYQLDPLGARVLVIPPGKQPAEGTWYPKPQKPIARPEKEPASVRIAAALRRPDPLDGPWQALPDGKSLPELGINDVRYVMYRGRIDLAESEIPGLSRLLVHTLSRDLVAARVNGKLAPRVSPDREWSDGIWRDSSLSHKRIGPADFHNIFEVSGLLRAGSNEITMVYENIGHEHGYVPMEELCGIDRAGLGADKGDISRRLSLEWASDLGGIAAGWNRADFTPNGWELVALETGGPIPRKGNGNQPSGTPDGLVTWYRLEFELPASDPGVWTPWMLRINASGNGYMWLNGHDIGRHYERGPQREFFLPECWLRTGPGVKNTIVLGLRQTSHGAVIRAAEVAPYPGASEIRGK